MADVDEILETLDLFNEYSKADNLVTDALLSQEVFAVHCIWG